MALSAAPSVKLRQDPIPNIRAAGSIIATGGHNADQCIRADQFGYEGRGNLGTPEHIAKYRRTNQQDPGTIYVHPGLREGQPQFEKSHAFGKVGAGSEHVETVLKAQNEVGLAATFIDLKEGGYASMKKEPLGRSMARGYNWPDQRMGQQEHAFGKAIVDSIPAKEILYTQGGSYEEKQATKEMYKKTHGNFAPGEQKSRGYEWGTNNRIGDGTGNVTGHVFGHGEKPILHGAAKAVHAERYDEAFPKTVIVKKIVEDQRNVQADMLGTSKNLGQGQTGRDASHVYGVANSNNDWNAAKCIQGEPTEKEVAPDRDLGKSLRANCTNTVRKPEDEHRSFGCPTIRTDIPYKAKRSVADYSNYGDEPEAVDLLFPATFTELGISEYDFQQPRSREAIKRLFECIGYTYKVGKFNTMYNRAKELCGSQDDCCSVRAFMMAVQQFHNVE